jgi:hypothetical protein
MTEAELREENIRVTRTPASLMIHVRTVQWDGQTPRVEWSFAVTVFLDSPVDMDLVIADLVRSPKYFGVCKDCSERMPVGHTAEVDLCQGCAHRARYVF